MAFSGSRRQTRLRAAAALLSATAAVRINNCGSFHFTPAGSEFMVNDLGGNTGGGTTRPWLAPWELPNTITCDDRPPVVPPPPPSGW
jgi:hypothetical protein